MNRSFGSSHLISGNLVIMKNKRFDFSKKSSTFVFMRILVLLFLFLPILGFSQVRVAETPFEHRMDSLAMANFKLDFSGHNSKSHILTYQPTEWVKFTFKSSINSNVITKINLDKLGMGDYRYSSLFGEFDATDYMSIAAYDIRAKVYFNRNTSIVGRVLVTGVQMNTYFYTIGFKHKF
jgi:hypothetical protein